MKKAKRERKPVTIIADLKRQLKEAQRERRMYHDEAYALRTRAQRAEEECREWKARFDALLERTPVLPVPQVKP